jgi:hypothetical protein
MSEVPVNAQGRKLLTKPCPPFPNLGDAQQGVRSLMQSEGRCKCHKVEYIQSPSDR